MRKPNYLPALALWCVCALGITAFAGPNGFAGYDLLAIVESAAPGTPAAGIANVYVATDGTLHIVDDGGTDTELGIGAGFTIDLPASAAVQQAGDVVYPGRATLATSGASVLAFDGGTDEDIVWWLKLPDDYNAAADLIVDLEWAAAGTSQAMEWELSVADLTGVDLDGATYSLDTANDSGSISSSATQGIFVTHTYALSNAQIDDAPAGAWVVFHLNRDASADTSAVDGYARGLKVSQ